MTAPSGGMKLSFGEKFGYGLGDTASNFVWALMMNFIMYYYTDIFGITAAATGTMLFFARSTDGFFDFFVGAVADRTHSRWGRFRPWLLWLCLPLAIVFVLAFTTPSLTGGQKLVWAWVTYNLLMLTYSAINIPYGALSGVMTDDPLERTSLNAYRMGLAQVGGIIANTGFLPLVALLGGSNPARGAQLTVLAFSFVAVALFLVCFAATRERIQPPTAQKTRLIDDVRTLLANPHWIMMFLVGTVNIALAVVRGSASIYYLKNYLGWDNVRLLGYFPAIPLYFFLGGLAMIGGAMLTRFVVSAIGKKRAFIASMAATALTAIPFYGLLPEQAGLIFTFHLLGTVAAGINATLYWTLVADTADYAEWKFGARTTGIIFSATTCAQKAGMGIGAACAGFLLDHYGYVPNVELSANARQGILLMMSPIPAMGLLLLAGVFCLYGLTEGVCRTMRDGLAARRLAR
jgi:GPH family glycoside/pentoside/hexuronide:cation symporter